MSMMIQYVRKHLVAVSGWRSISKTKKYNDKYWNNVIVLHRPEPAADLDPQETALMFCFFIRQICSLTPDHLYSEQLHPDKCKVKAKVKTSYSFHCVNSSASSLGLPRRLRLKWNW